MTDTGDLIEWLLPLARRASEQAYSPYSGVHVGAVAVGNDGTQHVGCNVENASYGLTQCAERNALGAAVVSGAGKGQIRSLLVYATGFESLTPCGACRQVISELMAPDGVVISCADDHPPRIWRPAELLPDPFSLEDRSGP